MNPTLVLLDASAFWRLRSSQLDPDRRRQVATVPVRRGTSACRAVGVPQADRLRSSPVIDGLTAG